MTKTESEYSRKLEIISIKENLMREKFNREEIDFDYLESFLNQMKRQTNVIKKNFKKIMINGG